MVIALVAHAFEIGSLRHLRGRGALETPMQSLCPREPHIVLDASRKIGVALLIPRGHTDRCRMLYRFSAGATHQADSDHDDNNSTHSPHFKAHGPERGRCKRI